MPYLHKMAKPPERPLASTQKESTKLSFTLIFSTLRAFIFFSDKKTKYGLELRMRLLSDLTVEALPAPRQLQARVLIFLFFFIDLFFYFVFTFDKFFLNKQTRILFNWIKRTKIFHHSKAESHERRQWRQIQEDNSSKKAEHRVRGSNSFITASI